MKTTKRKFKNKLEALYVPLPRRNVVAVSLWLRVGGRYESKVNSGISHFLEHLAFRGTQKRSNTQIIQQVEGIGGAINAFTSYEYTCFYAKSPKKHIKDILDVVSDIVLHPLMKEDDIKKEKKIILEEIRMYKDMPHYHVEDLMSEIMWKEHPLSRPLAGNYRSVRSLDCNMLSEYKKRFYHAGNMVAVIAGDINANNIDSFLKEIFANIPFKKKPQLNKFTLKQQEPQARYLNKDTQQTHLSLGFHTVKRTDKLRYALTVLSVLLGGNMSSRLFQQVREKKGLAYRISTSLRKYLDTGALVISCGLKNKKIKETINIILNELDKIKKKGITEEELSQAKEYIIGHTLLDLEATVDRMLQVGIKSITGDNETLDVKNIIKKIKKVKAEDVLQAANKFLKGKRLNLGLIGPVKKDIRSIEKRIKDF